MAEFQGFGSFFHPSLERCTTASLVEDSEGVFLFLSQPFPPSLRSPFYVHLLSVNLSLLYSATFPWEVLEIQQGEFNRRIMSESPSCSHFT